MDFNRNVCHGWTPRNYIIALEPSLNLIMAGASVREPFGSKKELVSWIKENQPFYRGTIEEVNSYFSAKYGLVNYIY